MFALSVTTDHKSKITKVTYQWNLSSALSEMFDHSQWNYRYMIMKRNTYNLKEGMIIQTTSSIIYESMEKRKNLYPKHKFTSGSLNHLYGCI